jgi:thiamine-phosphate diphosphorylase/hydroxyethylthiazole kinase
MMDLSLYLVTDHKCANCEDVVQEAVDNGATIVQLREKTLDTGALISKAQRIHNITEQAGIPLVINDRIDVCLAMDAEGVHLGNDDMDPSTARRLLGPNKIIGVTVHSLDELKKVISEGIADYVGIGAVYGTATKVLKCPPMGTAGVRVLMEYLLNNEIDLPSVLISGIDENNCAQVIEESTYQGRRAQGVAVVSCIMSSSAPGIITKLIRNKMDLLYHTRRMAIEKIQKIRERPPMIHHLTNTVVQNFSANVTLALGASPIMSGEPSEFHELTEMNNSALVLNGGAARVGEVKLSRGMEAYFKAGKHIVFDPVAIGASSFRRQFNTDLFLSHTPSIVKGNTGEIITLINSCMGEGGASDLMRGVDSTVNISPCELKKLIQPFTYKYQCIVVSTGASDTICFRDKAIAIGGGSPLMPFITGTGCSLGSVIASFVADIPINTYDEVFEAVVDAVACYKHCAKRAHDKCEGTGTFQAHFIDELNRLDKFRVMECEVCEL